MTQTHFNYPPPQISNATEFQQQTISEIQKRPEFQHWVGGQSSGDYIRQVGLFCVLWYDKQNHLHMTKIGVKSILRDISTAD